MNLLDPILRTASSSAVLATFKCFFQLAKSFPDIESQIYVRAKPPMLTLITGSHSEVQFVMLKHLQIILPRAAARGVFDDEYRQFFVRYNEPAHVKHLKIATLFFKPEAFKKDLKLDYIGIRIPNKFIVGFGLDYDGLGRNLPEVYQLKE
jgi:hypothetical protein